MVQQQSCAPQGAQYNAAMGTSSCVDEHHHYNYDDENENDEGKDAEENEARA